ncbi:MAG: ArsA-related P-loop ATPase [Mycobacteriales bacterium]
MSGEFAQVRLHVVTGKGGTGKTTVAGALALGLAAGGGRVLLTEVEGRQGIAQLFDCPPLGYEETWIASAPGGGELFALAVDPEAAFLEYLQLFYNMRRAGAALNRIGAIDFVTTIAPGLRDVLLTGKVKEAVTRNRRGGPRYDAVVLDAPPTGRIARFLNVNSEVAGLARVGPVRAQADSVMSLIRSPATAVHLVTVLEEMPVQETIDGVAELRAADLPVGAVIVNMVRRPRLSGPQLQAAAAGKLDTAPLVAGLTAGGLPDADRLAGRLAEEATEHAVRVRLEERERQELAGLGPPVYELDLVEDTVDLGGLYRLADQLRTQGAL